MRLKSRYLMLGVASVAALTVGGIASASHKSNVSSLPTFTFAPKDLPNGTAFKAGALTVQTHTNYAHPGNASLGGKAKTVSLLFDNDIKVSLSGIPACTAGFTAGTTIAQAWERCGPGADGPGEVNAYLSPAGAVSGRASTAPPSNFNGCTLVFKRASNKLLLFARVTLIQNGTANCSNPANNTSGNTSTVLTGTLANVGSGDFKTRLRVPNIDQLPLPLDDFKAKVKRGGAFKARCRDTNKRLNLKGTFQYSNDGAGGNPNQPNDVVNKTFACT
jgi:hypothetical protein